MIPQSITGQSITTQVFIFIFADEIFILAHRIFAKQVSAADPTTFTNLSNIHSPPATGLGLRTIALGIERRWSKSVSTTLPRHE
jgi:hypothetical protein